MQAVILAGGKGTRLKSLTSDIPKPMLPIGGIPLLEHQVSLLRSHHISEVIILVNHLKEYIQSHFADGKNWGINISYYEEKEPLGTVGGIKAIEERIEGDFLVLYGDVMVNMDLPRLISFHHEKKSECTLVLHPNDHPYDSDLVEMDQDCRITAFHPKPHASDIFYRNLVNAGLYLFTKKILKHLETGRKADFGREVFPRICRDIRMYGYNTSEYLKDMGTPDRLESVTRDYLSGKIERRSYRYPQKAVFLDRDGVLNVDNDLISSPEQFELLPGTEEAIKKLNHSDFLAVVATNQSVVARNLCSEEGLRQIHNKLETLLGNKHAKLDAIYYCPHHPDKGFPEENPAYKIECTCRKPKPGMLLAASTDFNIDLSSSFFIGDDQRDVEAGKAAGVTTVGVMTGKGLRKSKVQPDYFFANLRDAISFIVDDPFKGSLQEITTRIRKADKHPFVISIGGNSRSGKSTLATYLQKSLSKEGMTSMLIKLDNWILPKELRKPGHSVTEVFQLPLLISDIKKILSGKVVTLPGYTQHPSWHTEQVSYQYHNEMVVIIEGIVALADDALSAISQLSIFKHIEMDDLQARITAFYRWKGFSDQEIESLFQSRKETEYEIIQKTRKRADLVL